MNENIIYQNFNPDTIINLTNNTAGGLPTTVYSGELQVDLDLDGINDIKFYSYYGLGCSMTGCFKPTEGCEISALNNNHPDILEIPVENNDTINSNMDWTGIGSYSNDSIIVTSTFLSSYTPEWTNSEEKKNNPWLENNLFLSIRMKNGDTYKYGWIGMQIVDYYRLKIRDIGFEK